MFLLVSLTGTSSPMTYGPNGITEDTLRTRDSYLSKIIFTLCNRAYIKDRIAVVHGLNTLPESAIILFFIRFTRANRLLSGTGGRINEEAQNI